MSEELKRKLYDYEENPAPRVWDKILLVLDEEIIADFPRKLYDAAATPPPGVWDKVATALDADVKEPYAEKLYNLEIVPPLHAWERISSALEEEKGVPQIPSKRRIIPLVRYAAAASIIGVIAFGAVKLVLNDKRSNHVVAHKHKIPQNVAPTNVLPKPSDNSLSNSVAVTNNLPTPTTALAKSRTLLRKRTVTQLTQPPAYMALLANPSVEFSNVSAFNFQHANLKIDEVPGNCAAISEEDRYMSFMNPDGYLVRISKKLAEALKCYLPTGNDTDNQCDEQIKKWRDKIASPASTSPDNFMDVLNIIKSAQDKEL